MPAGIGYQKTRGHLSIGGEAAVDGLPSHFQMCACALHA
jgi:hypothetical protein